MDLSLITALLQNSYFNRALFIVLVAIITLIVASIFNRVMKKTYLKAVSLRQNSKKLSKAPHLDKTRFNLFRRFLISLVYLAGILLIMSSFPQLRKLSYSIFAGAGVIAIIIGFATQEVFSNIVSGFFIAMFEPFRIDDRVTIGNDIGHVEDVTLWHTVIRTFKNQRLMIPNSIIAKEKIENHTIADEKKLNFIEFGISYDSDIDLARNIISEELEKSPYYFDNRDHHKLLAKEEPYKIRVTSHGDFSIGLTLYAWTKTSTEGFFMKTDLLESVKKRFDKEGVEIPFPYRTIVEKKLLKKNKGLKAPKKKSRSKKK